MSITVQEALDYYSKLLIAQYYGLPKASDTIKCLVNQAICDGLPFELQECFDLDLASGAQLTIIGRIVGVPRQIIGLDLVHTFFNFTDYSGVPASNGFNTWSTPTDSDLIAQWTTTESYTTTDFELLTLIKLKIMYNNYYTSLSKIKDSLYEAFNGDIDVVDNLDSTITYNLKQPYYRVGAICTFLGNILPKPMGIGINVVNV